MLGRARHFLQRDRSSCPTGRPVGLQVAGGVGTSIAPSVLILSNDRGQDMKASRLLIAGTAIVMLPLAAAVAQSPTPDPAQPAQDSQQGATFESLDKDSDGRISKSEAAVNVNVTAQFSKYDLNGNGFIERDEVTSANGAQPDPSKQ